MDTNAENNTAAAQLRAQLELELRNKRSCAYASYDCSQLAIDGYKFCYRHILQDKNAPFKQCSYVYSTNGKRCQLPAPRSEKKDYGYCNEHALKATLARTKQNAKCPPPNTAEVLLCSLSHYIKKPKVPRNSNARRGDEDRTSADESDLKNVKHLDPFVDLDAVSIINGQCNEVLDVGSESESDIEPSNLATVWQDAHADSSDDESIDSENEDPLKYANVYTSEEITMITRDKLLRLQTLYVEQYRYLQHLIKEKRRKYLQALKKEKETCCNIYHQLRDSPKEQRLYKKLKALNRYHKPHGIDAIMHKRVCDMRAKLIDGTTKKEASHTKCTFTEGGVKCGDRVLPLARHCKKHILEDQHQVLFQPCGKVNGDIECTAPVAAIFDDSYCQLHVEIPPLRSYSQVHKDSESDMDDSTENHPPYSQFTDNVKTEFIHYDIPPDLPKMKTLPTMLFEESSQSTTSDCEQNENQMLDTNLSQDMEMETSFPVNANKFSEAMEIANPVSLLESLNIPRLANPEAKVDCPEQGGHFSEALDVSNSASVDAKRNLECETSEKQNMSNLEAKPNNQGLNNQSQEPLTFPSTNQAVEPKLESGISFNSEIAKSPSLACSTAVDNMDFENLENIRIDNLNTTPMQMEAATQAINDFTATQQEECTVL